MGDPQDPEDAEGPVRRLWGWAIDVCRWLEERAPAWRKKATEAWLKAQEKEKP